MTKPIERADVRSKSSDRRSFLRSALAIGATAAAGAPVALAALPAQPLAPSPISVPTPKQEAEGLVKIGRSMAGMLQDFWKASAELRAAQVRFDEIAPLPPRPRKRAKGEAKRMLKGPLFKIVRGKPAPYNGQAPMEVSASHAYESLMDAFLDREGNEFARKEIYQVSDRFQWKFFSVASDCGLGVARTRYRTAGHELRKVAGQAFEFKPETRVGVAAQAFALIGALEARDGRAGDAFAKALAMNMLEIEGELAPDNMTRLLGGETRAS